MDRATWEGVLRKLRRKATKSRTVGRLRWLLATGYLLKGGGSNGGSDCRRSFRQDSYCRKDGLLEPCLGGFWKSAD